MTNLPKILYSRNVYIDRIKPFMHTPIVKVMVGHRRSGKSYLLFQLIDMILKEETEANIIYINKENIEFIDMVSYKELNDYITQRLSNDKRNYIFIDEIQEIENFKAVVRSLALDDNNDIYITGSNSQMFSSDLANELGGRYVEFKIYSLSYIEFLEFHKLENNDSSLEKYIHFGGLPYLIHLPMEEAVVMEYIKSIYSTIVLRDVVERNKIRNVAFLDQLIRFLAGNIGSLFSSKSISDFLKSQNVKMSPTLVSEYADSLADAFVVSKAARYDIVGKRLFERGEKYYFENMGIRNVIAGYTPADRAKRLENIVYNHLLFCGYNVKVGTLATEEIDFVCTRNGETIYVQVAVELRAESTVKREFGNLLRIRDNYPKMVISTEQTYENSYEGVTHIYIRDFLSSSVTNRIV